MAAEAPAQQSRVLRGIIFALIGGTCWGFSGTCAQFLTINCGVPVVFIVCMRLIFASILFLAVAVVRDRERLLGALKDARSMAGIVVFAITGILMVQVSYLSAISYTNAGTGTVMERLGLILLTACVCIQARRLPRKREVVGVALAVVGAVLIATKGNLGTLAIPIEAVFWGGILACSFVCYTLLPEKLLQRWGSVVVTGLGMAIAGVIITTVIQPWTIQVNATPEAIAALAAIVIIGTFSAYFFYLQGVKEAGPMRAGLAGCIEPVSATVISAVWLQTPMCLADIVGMALIITMVVLVSVPAKGKEAAPVEG